METQQNLSYQLQGVNLVKQAMFIVVHIAVIEQSGRVFPEAKISNEAHMELECMPSPESEADLLAPDF